MADELFGSVEQAMDNAGTPPEEDVEVQAEGQTETHEEPTGTSLDNPAPSEDLEKLRKQLLGDYTRKTQEVAPLRRLIQEQGVTLEEIQTALQFNKAMRENPEALVQLLQAAIPARQAAGQAAQPPASQIPQPEADPVAALAETYGEEVAAPIRRVYEVAKQAAQTAAQLQDQLQKEREQREKEELNKALERAENSMTEWLGKNAHLGLNPKDLRSEIVRMVGKQGILAGLSAKDFDAAALRVLGPEKYQEAVYTQRLQAARKKVDEKAPARVVVPGAATATAPKRGPGFENPRDMLSGALEYIESQMPH